MKQKYQAQGSTSENKMCVCARDDNFFSSHLRRNIFCDICMCAELKRDKVLSLPQRNGSCRN